MPCEARCLDNRNPRPQTPARQMTQTTLTEQNSTSNVGQYWRSLDQVQGTDSFQEFLHREFPQAASEFPEGVSRRRWMQLMSASFALAGAAGCRWETEKILPFAERPEGYIPGKPEHFATNIQWGGQARHLLVTKYDGRPIKMEGNPEHPLSQGATDGYTQAATLSLYDPDRSTAVRMREAGQSFAKEWTDFEAYLSQRIKELGDGTKLALLMQPLDSFSLYDALDRVAAKFPAAKFYQYEPLSRETELEGARLAFGRRLRTNYKLADAKVIASFDGDPLSDRPDSLSLARSYADGRDPDGKMNRLYAVESQFSTTGAAADHRLPVKSSAIGAMLAQLRDQVKAILGAESKADGKNYGGSPTPDQFIEVLAEDLVDHKEQGAVIVGTRQPAEVHAIAFEINSLLGNVNKTVLFTPEPKPNVELGNIADLTGAIRSGQVDTVVVLDGNPAYDAPANVPFAEALDEAKHTIRLGVYDDETSRHCMWSLPETHPLEQWGDVIGWDGSIGITQPMIEPIAGGRSKLHILSLLAGDQLPDTKQLVATSVADRADALLDEQWNRLLHWGFQTEDGKEQITTIGFEPVNVSLSGGDFQAPATESEGLEIVFTTSSSVLDGRFANNAWLQETPDFLTKLTWDNAALVSPTTAEELKLEQGKLAEITIGDVSVEVPVYIMPGQAVGSIGLALGYGRTAAGRVGGLILEDGSVSEGLYVNGTLGLWLPTPANPVGTNIYPLRTSETPGFVTGVEAPRNTRKGYLLATTQDHHAIDQGGLEAIGTRTGELIREASQEHYEEHPDFAPHMSHDVHVHDAGEHRATLPLWNLPEYKGNAWGMSIDLNKCIGCNACSVACQAENNVPVVGKDQVSKGREMHWIRIDRYFKGVANPQNPADPVNFENPEVAHQPIACQQCETAPCEQVCPVAATMHSDEGLNDMVYNRCIGTRYCANNCPYKVRRFNYFRYTKKLYESKNEMLHLAMNPEVTVRSRGVMEKCTYCVQRISAARIEAKNEARPIRDGDIQAACQQACSTKAIEFGDINDSESRVRKAHENPRAYGILTELMTKPRTKFLAKIRNPHARLARVEVHQIHGIGDSHDHDSHGHDHDNDHSTDHKEDHA